MAEHSPIIGVGFGNYEVIYDDFRLPNWKEPLGHAHNYYLNIFAETGIIGVSAYLLMWIGIVLLTWKIRQHPDNFARGNRGRFAWNMGISRLPQFDRQSIC